MNNHAESRVRSGEDHEAEVHGPAQEREGYEAPAHTSPFPHLTSVGLPRIISMLVI